MSINTYEWGRSYNDYVPLAIAKTIHNEHNSSDDEIKIFCYKIWDFGFYNATDLTPNNYFFAKNVFDREHFPQMYESHESAITNQISDFVITELSIWEEEKDFLSQYYKPYHEDIQASTYNYRIVSHFFYKYYDFVLLKTI